MKTRVLWVYQSVRLPDGGKIEAGQKPSVCIAGRTRMLAVAAGHPVRVLVRPIADFDALRPVFHGKAEHGVLEAVRTMRGIGRRCGITKAAKTLLGRIEDDATAEKATAEIEDEEEFENEEDIANQQAPSAHKETTMTSETNAGDVAGETTGAAAEPIKAKRVRKTAAKKTNGSAKSAKKAARPRQGKGPGAKTAKKRQSGATAKVAGGREGTISALVVKMAKAGADNEAISKAAQKAFPDSKSTDMAAVAWYRWNAGRKGLLPAVTRAKKVSKKK